MKKVLLLDGYNFIYRSRYSSALKGPYTTIFNFFRSLRPMIEKFDPDICYFVLEGVPKLRLALDSNYKGQRVYSDHDNFREQRKEIIKMLEEYFPIVLVKHDDYECDDVLNYLANVKHKDDLTVMVSTDTDFIQSINDNNLLYNPVRKSYVDQFEYDYVSWKSLVGDKSDNIEGFKGIGNKKAIALLENNDKFKEFLSDEENNKKFNKNMKMISFHDLSEESNNIKFKNPKLSGWDNLKNIFINLEFNSIISKEKTWKKYINTFDKLESEINNVN